MRNPIKNLPSIDDNRLVADVIRERECIRAMLAAWAVFALCVLWPLAMRRAEEDIRDARAIVVRGEAVS